MKRGLIVKSPWIDYILAGNKIWELRTMNTNIRGRIFLIRSGGEIEGEIQISESLGPLDSFQLRNNLEKHKVSLERINVILNDGKKKFAWVLHSPIKYPNPVPYEKKPGAVIWVNLEDNPYLV
tara:strand:- start:41 stop:409 length:369 start_codon:yes stop_codon:yes gene_type:complete